MKAIVDIRGGGNMPAEITYYCSECGHKLETSDDDMTAVEHPSDEGIFRKKPITCRYAGKKFRKPVVELEAI